VTDGENRRTDTVRVLFSEAIISNSGAKFSPLTTPPPEPPYVCQTRRHVGAGRKHACRNSRIHWLSSDSLTLYFVMENGRDLTENNYINILTPDPLVMDRFGNRPTPENQKVRVIVIQGPVVRMCSPTFRRNPEALSNADLQLFHNENARQWVVTDRKGS